MDLYIEFLGCVFATIFFGLLIQQPKNTLFITALIALNGYILFKLTGGDLKAYFISGLLVGIMCEIASRVKKMTATVFLISSIIPLVPGYGLYRSVVLLAAKDYTGAIAIGAETIGGLCCIALALTIATMITSNIPIHKRS